MTMIIDIDKFVASLVKHYCDANNIDRSICKCWLDDALEEQGLEYKDCEIIKTQRRIAAEAKEAIFDDDGEDEKIRKEMLNVFKQLDECTTICGRNYDYAKWIAWLEKQGELPEGCVRKQVAEAKEALYSAPCVDTINGQGVTNQVSQSEVTKISEQVWSEEDERLCKCLINDQEEALDNVNNSKYGHSEIISDLKEMYNERISWLESLKTRLGEK